jgi:hypothetical protein
MVSLRSRACQATYRTKRTEPPVDAIMILSHLFSKSRWSNVLELAARTLVFCWAASFASNEIKNKEEQAYFLSSKGHLIP